MDRNNLKTSLVYQLPAFCVYLDALGYESADCVNTFFQTVALDRNLASMSLDGLADILVPMIAKNRQEQKQLIEDMAQFFKEEKNELSSKIEACNQYYQEERKQLDDQLKKNQLSMAKLQKVLDAGIPKNDILTDKQKKELEQKRTVCGLSFSDVIQGLKENQKYLLRNLAINAIKGEMLYTKQQLDLMRNAIKEAMKKAVLVKNFQETLDYLSSLYKILDLYEGSLTYDPAKKYKQNQKKMEQMIQKQEELNKKIELQQALFQCDVKEILEENRLLQKERSIHHRKDFVSGYQMVQSDFTGEHSLLSETFDTLQEKDKTVIYEYIRQNAKQFKERFSKNIRTAERQHLDLAEICKMACSTGGIPMRLAYQKPKRDRTNLLIFLDVSGSCKKAAELMLIFLYYMQDVFSGGCHLYAFTNILYPISEFMEAEDAGSAAKKILEAIPRSGAYSNYERSFRQFCTEHMNEVSNDTVLFFIGDARNNKNPSGEEYVKAIARKSRKAYWMNTDVREKWGQGDSIIWTYAPYMHAMGQVRTPGELIQFLTRVR